MRLSAREILIRARNRIARPGGWTSGYLLNDKQQCCALGGIALESGIKVEPETDLSVNNECVYEELEGKKAVKILAQQISSSSPHYTDSDLSKVMDYNDSHKQAQVVAMFDKAIDAAPKPRKRKAS